MKQQPLIRRSMLSVTSSVYDPASVPAAAVLAVKVDLIVRAELTLLDDLVVWKDNFNVEIYQ